MHALVSLLDRHHYDLVEALWGELERECGLTGVQVTPYPHFSWQIAMEYPEPETEEATRAIARQARPFTVRAEGLGIFSGPNPVVYIPVIRSAELNRLHAGLWEQFQPLAQGLSPFYGPQRWVPHITLIFGPEPQQAVQCGLQKLAFRAFDWEIEVNNLTFVSQFEGEIGGLSYQHDFAGGGATVDGGP